MLRPGLLDEERGLYVCHRGSIVGISYVRDIDAPNG